MVWARDISQKIEVSGAKIHLEVKRITLGNGFNGGQWGKVSLREKK